MSVLIGIIVALLGGLFYTKVKSNAQGALLENADTKQKLLDVDRSNLVDSAKLQEEKDKVAALKEEHERIGPNENSIKDVLDFFNQPK